MPDNVLTEEMVREMSQLGIIYGHKKSKTHPRMAPFIAGNRNNTEFIDPQIILESLDKAVGFMKEKFKNGGLIIFVGTTPAAKEAVLNISGELGMPYVVSRWLGGTLTNFSVINERLRYYEDLKVKKARGDFAKYTKKEQRQFDEKISKLSKFFDGLANLKKLPDIVFIVDIKIHSTALKEARLLKIPIVAVLDTDDDPDLVEYPIFASDHNKAGIDWMVDRIKKELKSNG